MATMRGTDIAARPEAASIAAGLEQVREILFGQQSRDFERKLARIDSHLAADAQARRAELRQRIEVLQAHIDREVEALATRMAAEQSAHSEAVNKLARESREAVATMEQRVARLEEGLARAQRDTRQQIVDQAKQFLDEMHQVRGEILSSVEREVSVRLEGTEGGFNPSVTGDGARDAATGEKS